MPEEIAISIGCKWKWEDGDGTLCIFCGDAAWMKQLRLVFVVAGTPEQPTDFVLCRSCGELIK